MASIPANPADLDHILQRYKQRVELEADGSSRVAAEVSRV